MVRILNSFLFILVFTVCAFAQNEETLVTIGGENVSKAEFEYIYRKNNNNLYNDTDKKSPEDYLNLFIDFKLKVIEAENLKMDTSRAFINELEGYRNEVAEPYLTDIKYNDQLVHELYNRMQFEINASHILLMVDKGADEAKKQEVLERITKIREEIIAGKDFTQAALEYSEDPTVENNKGNLGYFSAFTMVAPFEDAAYNTPAGEVSEPVETNFGYHLIKVNDKRKNKGEILVAHIMKSIPNDATSEEIKEIRSKIDFIYKQLEEGADFSELAKNESQDRRSALNGGKLPWFSSGRVVSEFANAAFALKNPGDISIPVKTNFGYHIIKKLDSRPVPDFEEAKANIEEKIRKDKERSSFSRKAFIENLKAEYGFTENKNGKKMLEGIQIEDKPKIEETILFTIDSMEYNSDNFLDFVHKKKIKKGPLLQYYNGWVDDEIISLEDSKLEEKYPEFRYLMKEYHDGILLFNISQEKIWNLASEDTVGLENFYSKNKKEFSWGERFKGNIITCESNEIREKAEDLLGSGMNIEEVAEHLNSDKEVIKFEEGAWEEGTNHIVDYYVWNGKTPDNFNSETTFVRGDKIAPEPKTLEEARGLYISEYQNYLEKNWLTELHKKYKIKVNKQLLKTIEGV